MSATVDYQVVIDRLTDAIKELNQPCAGETAVPISEEERRADLRADTADLLKQLLSALEQGPDAASAAAEHGAAAEHTARTERKISIRVIGGPGARLKSGRSYVDLVFSLMDTVLTLRQKVNSLFETPVVLTARSTVCKDLFNQNDDSKLLSELIGWSTSSIIPLCALGPKK
jgi:hypothetical protein